MKSNKSHLEKLVGKTLLNTNIGTSTVVGIKIRNETQSNEKMSISIQLHFEDYFLNIYNPIEIIPSGKDFTLLAMLLSISLSLFRHLLSKFVFSF